MYNPDYYGIQNLGWTCPKCGRSYAPSVAQCLYCNDSRVIYATQTSDDWWKTTTNISSTWEDMMRRSGLLDDE